MFYKFGDNTKTKTVITKESKDKNKEEFLDDNVEVFDENDDTNRRSAIIKDYMKNKED